MTTPDFRQALRARRLSLVDVAAACGYTYRTVRAYWYGERPVPPAVEEYLRTGKTQRREAPGLDAVVGGLPDYRELQSLRRRAREDRAGLLAAQAAIRDMCQWCEPEGPCRDGSCPLRRWSPKPLVARRTGT